MFKPERAKVSRSLKHQSSTETLTSLTCVVNSLQTLCARYDFVRWAHRLCFALFCLHLFMYTCFLLLSLTLVSLLTYFSITAVRIRFVPAPNYQIFLSIPSAAAVYVNKTCAKMSSILAPVSSVCKSFCFLQICCF